MGELQQQHVPLIEKFFDGGGPGWTLTHVGGGLQFYAAGAIVITSPPLAVPSGVWHHILTRRSGTLYQVFYDGIVVVAGPSAAPISGITMPLLIGKRNDFDGRDFAVDGRIDEVAIWSRALSDDEVAFLFNGGRGNPVASLGVVPFAALSAEVEIERDDAFEVRAAFTLGAGSNGIAPLTEDVKLRVGTFSITIPAGSFTQDGEGEFKFEGVIAGVTLEVEIEDLGGGSFEFKAEGEGANLTGTVNPVTVALTIGDDVGTTAITTKFN